MPPKTITVRIDYCHEHYADHHAVDHLGKCYGETLKDVENLGYSWPRHIGGGWFRFTYRKPQMPLDWAMAAAEQERALIDAELNEIDF